MKTKTPYVTANLAARPSPLNLRPEQVDPLKRARPAVAIVCFAEPTRYEAPLTDPRWEVWGLNNNFQIYQGESGSPLTSRGAAVGPAPGDLFRADRWFEVHPRAIADDERVVTDQPQALAYVVDAAEWPEGNKRGGQVATFPRELAMAAGERCYFACTMAYQIALAIALQYDEIGLYGCELNTGREGLFEKASVAYWLGVAEGRGVKVTLPTRTATLWHPALYGLEYWKEVEYVGHLCRLIQPTIRKTTHRPPMKRPPESYEWEKQARRDFPR